MTKPKLTEADVLAIIALRKWVNETPVEQRCMEIRGKENALPPAAREWWYSVKSADTDAELRRWKPSYRIEKTRAGYRVFRLLKTRGVYRVKPSKTGLSDKQVEEYRELVRI
jgi:hypothetical protein